MRSSIALIAALAEQSAAIRFRALGITVADIRRRALVRPASDIAGIQAFGDLADVLAERLAVPQVHRAGERIDLRAGVVDDNIPW